MSKAAKKNKSRLYLMGGLIFVWALVLFNEFGGGTGEADASTPEVVTPKKVAGTLDVVPDEEQQKKNRFLASKEILALQRAESLRPLGRNIFGSKRSFETTQANPSSDPTILNFIGRGWVLFNNMKVRVGQKIPGTSKILKAIEHKKGRVIVERPNGETYFVYRGDLL